MVVLCLNSSCEQPNRHKVHRTPMLRNLFSKSPRATDTAPEAASERPEPPEARSYTVGWLLNAENASVIWDSPRPIRIESQSSDPRSVGQCPSVLDFDRRHFSINCPIDVHLRLSLTPTGMDITNVLADKSPIRSDALAKTGRVPTAT